MAQPRPDEGPFDALVERHRGELHAHCYRMLGSVHDADDALQETLLRAWRGLAGLRGGAAARAWLYRIATNVCLDAIGRRPPRVLPMDFGPAGVAGDDPLPSATWIEPYPDSPALAGIPAGPAARYEQREALELAFVAALQHLPARQRAALVLCDVLGFSAREAADALETTPASVTSGLQRARRALEARAPQRSQQRALSELGDDGLRALVDRFVAAFEGGDMEAIVELLAEDVVFAMPPHAEWSAGRDEVSRSWLMPEVPGASRLRYVRTTANGQLAFGCYALAEDGRRHRALALDVLAVGDGRITGVVAFRDPDLFARFGLPEELPA